MKKTIVTFKNRDNETLVGILHEPNRYGQIEKTVGIVLSNTGIHYRVAWHRLNVSLAEMLGSEGYSVFRFDPHGIGDSEGELGDTEDLIHHYDAIQQGLFVNDAVAAIDLLKDQYGFEKICLVGFCGGALTSILTAGCDPRVDGVIFACGPVTISSEIDLGRMHPVYAKHLLNQYFRKVLRPGAWFRAFSGKTNYKLIREVVTSFFHEKRIRAELINGVDGGKEKELFNRQFLTAFNSACSRGTPILFLMAEIDPATYQFENYFSKEYLQKRRGLNNYDVYVIPNANHTFTDRDCQTKCFELIVEWLRKNEECF